MITGTFLYSFMVNNYYTFKLKKYTNELYAIFIFFTHEHRLTSV